MQVGTVTPEQRRQRFWHQHVARHFQKRCAHGKHYTCDFRGHVLIRSLHGQSEQPPPLPPPPAPLLLAAPPSMAQAPQAMLAPAPPTPLVPHVAQVPDVDSPLMLLCESSSREVPCFELSARRHFFCFRVVEARPAAQKQIDDNPMARFEPEEMLISLRRILAVSPQGQGHSITVSSEATALQASSACETVFAWKLPPDLSLFQLRTGVLEWETAPALARDVKLLVGIPLEVRDRAQDLVARLIRAGAVEAEGDTPQLAHTVPHSSNNADATSRCLDILQARGIIAKTHTAPCIAGGSNWYLTKHGAQALCIGEVLSGARPIMSHDPDQDPQQFTMHELLDCLDLQEWSMQEYAGRGRSRRTIPEPFQPWKREGILCDSA